MKLVAFVVLTCGLLICLLLLYQWGVKKLGLDKPQQPARRPRTPIEIYSAYRVYYEDMADCLHRCLLSVGRICYLNCPRDVQKLYAAQIADRVKIIHGRVVFCYEIARTGVQTSLNKPSVYNNTCADIARVLKANLPAYLTPGLSFSDIVVYDIGNDYVRIVIENVNKVINCSQSYTGGNYGGSTGGNSGSSSGGNYGGYTGGNYIGGDGFYDGY